MACHRIERVLSVEALLQNDRTADEQAGQEAFDVSVYVVERQREQNPPAILERAGIGAAVT